MELKDGFKVVPVEPTADQYGELARDIIQWMRVTPSSDQHSQSLIDWLKNMGKEIPSWLTSKNEINHLSKHVLSKIYKAMLATAPELKQIYRKSERLEKKLTLENEKRKELINYYELNKKDTKNGNKPRHK